MKKLQKIYPTAEQLPLISETRFGVEVIRGAAGSGKTSTAILRLRSLLYVLEERRERVQSDEPIKVLVLAFNRTLSGYVRALVDLSVQEASTTQVTVDTFGHWAMTHLNFPKVIANETRERMLVELATPLEPPSPSYIVKEVDYLLGRFPPEALSQYLVAERTGRGAEPRVERPLRKRILREVVEPYKLRLREAGKLDWNDVAVAMAKSQDRLNYDVIIVDETQDFSANQIRAIKNHAASDHAITFVIDTVQRIYARGFTWAETGFPMANARYHNLRENHRNTRQIAAFARGILTGMPLEGDGELPDLKKAGRDGPKPVVLRGRYNAQARWAIDYIQNNIDLTTESVAFLKPLGGAFFREIILHLRRAGLDYVDITRDPEWPEGTENIALSTLNSAKGLEFDHVFILGLSKDNTSHGSADQDDQLTVLRRLLAVGVARARKTVTAGYKPGEESRLVSFFSPGTFRSVDL